jgi:hypothetical protein
MEASLSQSKMLKARRRKQKARKHLAGLVKRAKKIRKQNVKMGASGAGPGENRTS